MHAAPSNVVTLTQTKHGNAGRSLEALKAVEEWQQEECELVKAQVQHFVQDSSAFSSADFERLCNHMSRTSKMPTSSLDICCLCKDGGDQESCQNATHTGGVWLGRS